MKLLSKNNKINKLYIYPIIAITLSTSFYRNNSKNKEISFHNKEEKELLNKLNSNKYSLIFPNNKISNKGNNYLKKYFGIKDFPQYLNEINTKQKLYKENKIKIEDTFKIDIKDLTYDFYCNHIIQYKLISVSKKTKQPIKNYNSSSHIVL